MVSKANKVEKASERWQSFLEAEKPKDELEQLKERRLDWHGWLVPSSGPVEMVAWVIQRACWPVVWCLVCGQLGRWFGGRLGLMLVVIWLAPIVGFGFVCWMQRHSAGLWVYVSLGIVAFGLAVGMPGLIALVGG